MAGTVTASNGQAIPDNGLDLVLGYSGSNVTSLTQVYSGVTYVQTITYSGSNVTEISEWVAQ